MELAEQLSGHRGEVLSLSPRERSFVSGSSDGTVRVWDWPRSNTSVKCVFIARGADISGVVCSPVASHRLFVASGCQVFEYDLRGDQIVIQQSVWRKSLGRSADDEINSIALSAKGNYLAACDDAGDVAVMDLSIVANNGARGQDTMRWRRMRRGHSSIASGVLFRAGTSWELISGSFDSTVVCWDYGRGRANSKLDLSPSEEEAGEQLVNPPFVHAIAVESRTRGRLAVALGSGDVAIATEQSGAWQVSRGTDVHRAATTAVTWLGDRVISAGVDRRIVVWRPPQDDENALNTLSVHTLAAKPNVILGDVESSVILGSQNSSVDILRPT